jgi:hypothetical protein
MTFALSGVIKMRQYYCFVKASLVLLLPLLFACGDSNTDKSTVNFIENTSSVTVEQSLKVMPKVVKSIPPKQCLEQAQLPATNFATHNPNDDGVAKEKLLTSFTVKESSGLGTSNFPVSMVFPLPFGEYFYVGDFHIKTAAGNVVPTQFNVINRWWAKDRSLRHVQAHFNTNIPAYQQGKKNTGSRVLYLYAGNGNIAPEHPVCLSESLEDIRIDNGLITITIQKNPLVINTPAGQLTSIFTTENGDSDYSFNHDDIKIVIEEFGLQRSVVKISSLTKYITPTNIKHGWALRLYTYANSSIVKVDFQLQNSAINTVFSAPLYFKGHQLVLNNIGDISALAQSVSAKELKASKISEGVAGSISSERVNVFYRDFWQTFPSGLQTSTTGELAIELWPSWSKQFLNDHFIEGNYYWLDDMKQTYKELLFDFSMNTEKSYVNNLAHNFQYRPVAILPQEYYQKTRVTLELGGYFPLSSIKEEERRLPQYKATDFTKTFFGFYKFGLDNFGIDLYRKTRTSNAGGWAYSNRKFFVSGNPKNYYAAQNMAKAELNIRPQWLSGYEHNNNFNYLKPSTNPYAGNTWRKFINHQTPTLTRKYLEGSKRVANPRDDQHAWFYHLEQAYLMSGDKWLKDWFEFMAEFKQIYLQELDPWPDRSNRAEGQAISVALSAYKVTGNKGLGKLLSDYTTTVHSKYLLLPHNISVGSLALSDPKAAVFQQGYLVKSFIGLYQEFPDQVATLNLIKNYVDWNFTYSNFGYYRSVTDYKVIESPSGSSATFVDAAIWYAIHSGDKKYAEHAIKFIKEGFGGVKAYGNWGIWHGQYEGQLYNYYLQNN